MHKTVHRSWISSAAVLALSLKVFAAASLTPTELRGLRYTNDFFPGTTYRTSVPKAETLLGFPLGQRAATSLEIDKCLTAWAAAAPETTKLVEYARTYEGRPLHYMVVTAPRNLTRLDEIQREMATLADPRKLTATEAKELIEKVPPVAWLAYTIHGDETEGSDAALSVLYHLIAAEGPTVRELLEKVVVIIDPLMNPDGRDRFLRMVAEHRGTMPNVDDQSLVHTGYVPWGRGNHYYFDLNRDWIFGVHPETRGRLREISRWNPVLLVDAHGMGPQDTHLFSPPRPPINVHIPPSRERWAKVFAHDQARAFDEHGLIYYHGEWNEDWYPGYSDSWPAYRGAVGILYEQARIAEDGVRRPEGRILSYRESVFHHVLGSMANLGTLQQHGKELIENFFTVRRAAVDPQGPCASRTFALLPSANRSRVDRFVQLAQLQGFELFQAGAEFTTALAVDQLGRESRNRSLPAGTLLIPNRQPLGYLVSATLDFDPRIPPKALEEERQEILRKGRTRIYDVTAWNLTMMFDLEALTLLAEMPESAKPYPAATSDRPSMSGKLDTATAFVIRGADDLSVAAAARLMEKGIQVRVAEKPFRFDEQDFERGSVIVTRLDNRAAAGDFRRILNQTLEELSLTAVAISSGFADGELPNLGGEYFKRMEPPRIALLNRGGSSPYSFGESWLLLDHQIGIRHSHLDLENDADLARYNVIVAPERFGGPLPGAWTNQLKEWVKAGGTLVAIGNTAAQFAQEKGELSKVRLLPDVLAKLGEYEIALFREWLARSGEVPASEAVWSHAATPGLKYPWQAIEGTFPDEKELKKRDAWQQLFLPQGAIVAGRADTNHWLTFGCGEKIPLLAFGDPILMAGEGVDAPVRLGYLRRTGRSIADDQSAPPGPKSEPGSEKKDGPPKEAPRVGWATLPPDTEMNLRMSGLLWPEAAHRLANSAFVTRESFGRGQIILFATDPAFRAATLGPIRLLLNALIYGPGFGAAQPVRP